MEDAVYHYGYAGLFLVSFLAATLLPLSSEAGVVAMQVVGANPLLILLVATAGNSLGGMTSYLMGRLGDRFVLSRWLKPTADDKGSRLQRARNWFQGYGERILFFSWVPVVGDPLVLAAGVLRADARLVTFWVILGKGLRYAVLMLFVAETARF